MFGSDHYGDETRPDVNQIRSSVDISDDEFQNPGSVQSLEFKTNFSVVYLSVTSHQ